jgi:hypothetical protein
MAKEHRPFRIRLGTFSAWGMMILGQASFAESSLTWRVFLLG